MKANVVNKKRDDIGAELMNAISTAEIKDNGKMKKLEVYNVTVKPWIDKCELKSYTKFFSAGIVNKKCFIELLRLWMNAKWSSGWIKLQQEFSKTNLLNIVDCETEDKEIFYLSLYNQFLEVLKIIPCKEIWDEDTSTPQLVGMKNIEQNQTEDIAKEKEIYEMSVSLDSALEKLGNEALGQEIYSVFREIYDDSGIPDYIQGMPKREFDITPFVEDIEQNLLEIYRRYFYDETYMHVVEFCKELKKFNDLTALYTLKMPAETIDDLVEQQRKKLKSLYKAMGASKTHGTFISYDHATDEVLFRRSSLLDD